jgi:regulator of protease activity HflC (stomatin/prohibitin superfamily)
LVVSIFDHVVAIIHVRIQTTVFNAEQALTKDTVPVNVDAIIFWHVADAKKKVALHHRSIATRRLTTRQFERALIRSQRRCYRS